MEQQERRDGAGTHARRASMVTRALGLLVRLTASRHRDQRGIAGLETAILMTAFVASSSALGAAYVNSSLQTND